MMQKDLLQRIADALVNRNETIAIAESVTAGLLMSSLSLGNKATEYFQGGMTVYNLGQKTRQLSVDPILAQKANCVSEIVTEQMALHIAKQFCSHWGVGVTGYAVPVPEMRIEKCFAFYAISHNGNIIEASRIDAAMQGQLKVQKYFRDQILMALSEALGRN